LTEKIGSFEHFAKPDTEIGLIHYCDLRIFKMRNGTFKKKCLPIVKKNTPTITTTHRLKKSKIEITKKINEKKN